MCRVQEQTRSSDSALGYQKIRAPRSSSCSQVTPHLGRLVASGNPQILMSDLIFSVFVEQKPSQNAFVCAAK